MLIRLFVLCAVMAGFAVGFAELVDRNDTMSRGEPSAMNCTDPAGMDCGGLMRVR